MELVFGLIIFLFAVFGAIIIGGTILIALGLMAFTLVVSLIDWIADKAAGLD